MDWSCWFNDENGCSNHCRNKQIQRRNRTKQTIPEKKRKRTERICIERVREGGREGTRRTNKERERERSIGFDSYVTVEYGAECQHTSWRLLHHAYNIHSVITTHTSIGMFINPSCVFAARLRIRTRIRTHTHLPAPAPVDEKERQKCVEREQPTHVW